MTRVAIVGGGPAGLIAATTLRDARPESELAITVYDHRRSVGRKFLLAGRGGLNITHNEPIEQLLDRYGPERTQLEAAIRGFDPDDLRAFCARHGEETFVGTSGRVFPESFRATPLLRSWLTSLADQDVAFMTGYRWNGWLEDGLSFERSDGSTIAEQADATILALGGPSWPRVGSDASWYGIFESAGISMTPMRPANSGVVIDWSPVLQGSFAGHPIKNAVFAVGRASERASSARGDAVITRTGLEGGPIYALGRLLRSTLDTGDAGLVIDLHPDVTVETLRERLAKRRPKASVSSWLSSAGVSKIAVALLREVTGNKIPNDPAELAAVLKALPLPVAGLADMERAISSAGGVSFDAVDSNLMLHDKPGTFVAGEMLDWEAPTGGYLLQACFSTGVAAARGALAWLA